MSYADEHKEKWGISVSFRAADEVDRLRADLAAARAEKERAKVRLGLLIDKTHAERIKEFLSELAEYLGLDDGAKIPEDFINAASSIRQGMETQASKLAALSSECEALKADKARDLESDSIVASCNCLTKTNETKYHKPGCKYRLICERDAAKGLISALGSDLVEIQRIAAFDLSSDVADRIFQYCKRPLAAIDAAKNAGKGG